jgi:LPPG:FO 2-phospho-L-lactate transferase
MTTASRERDLVLALSGGVGGAQRVPGLSKVVPPDRLVVVANTGDDVEHLGLHALCPKLTGQTGRLKGSQNYRLSQRELPLLRAY